MIDTGRLRHADLAWIRVHEAAIRHRICSHRWDDLGRHWRHFQNGTQTDALSDGIQFVRKRLGRQRAPAQRGAELRKVRHALGRVVPHHFTHKTAGYDAVRDVKTPAQRQRQSMNCAARRVRERHARKMRADGHAIARRFVCRLMVHDLQRASDVPRCLKRQAACDGRRVPGDERLHRVNQRVHARCGGDMRRQSIRKRGVYNSDVREDARVYHADFISRGLIGEDRHKRRFRAGACRCWNQHGRQSARPGFSDTEELPRGLSMPRTERRDLRRVHHTAATERDDDIRTAGLDALGNLVHHIDGRLGRHFGKRLCEQVRIEQGL